MPYDEDTQVTNSPL